MIINAKEMYNYQIVCNDSYIIGIIHSFSQEIINASLKNISLKLDRKKNTQVLVTNTLVTEE